MDDSIESLWRAPRFEVVRKETRTADGKTVAREWIRHPGAVTIVPMLDHDRVCLIRNHRIAVDATLIELPAGTLDPGEDPDATARRELREETGYRAGCFRLLHEFYMSPGVIDERMFVYAATDLTAGDPAREANEQIENLVVPWDDALAMAEAGQIHDAKTLVGLLYYDRIRQKGMGI